ncbi:MAG: multicopper oxidase family protein, partial [Actinobacteria bacterium]|nr:multicopper oxidase family protein [Actinomycetota bacterium]
MYERRFLTLPLTRRAALGAGLAGAAAVLLAGCAPTPRYISPTAAAVGSAETARNSTGRVVTTSLRAQATTLDLAGTQVPTWSFGSIPAPIIRANVGDTIEATLINGLPEETTIHWHGLALRNDMDGVPGITQNPVAASDEFTYRFIAPDAGTYWLHPHVGTQLDRGLYGALIIDDPNEPLAYDEEWVVVFDDWLDGVTATPPEVLEDLRGGMAPMPGMEGHVMRMGNMLMGTNSDLLGGDSGDVFYPHYLINGRPPADPETYTARPGTRVRLRMINAGSDTAFRVALGGHRMTITHSDGFPVEPVEVDGVLLAMGERYDVLVTLGDGVFPLVAEAEG